VRTRRAAWSKPEATWAPGAPRPTRLAERAPAGQASPAERQLQAGQASPAERQLQEAPASPAERQLQAAPAPAVGSTRVARGLAEWRLVALAARRQVAPPNPGQAERPSSRLAAPALLNRVTVSLSSLQQRISGFGVSSAWAGDFRDPENDPDMLWSTTTGAGLTLHRIRIGGGTTSETRIAQRAVEYGVRVWATPWEVNEADTDRPMCPTNDPCDPPPKLTDPEDWANRLVDFVATMEDAGVPIYAISAENEPDSGGMNHTVSFTATELAEWIGGYLGPALANTNTKVMAPETMNWWGFPEYFTAIQDNGAAWEHVSIFASHAYGLGPREPEPAITDAGKEYWQTEVDTGRAADDPTGDNMPTALNLAETIHSHLTQANLNAWHYWWLWAGGTSGVFNTDTNVWTKRLWVMGNFSRFVRPGYRRVSTSGTAPSGVLISAYTNSADGTVVVVAINHNTSATSVSLFIADAAPCTVTPWVTSDTDNIAAKTPITVTDARFTASLEAKSVTSFVGTP
jgi:glucuronoarabinoxylan endo-1,4-beta-xylanase